MEKTLDTNGNGGGNEKAAENVNRNKIEKGNKKTLDASIDGGGEQHVNKNDFGNDTFVDDDGKQGKAHKEKYKAPLRKPTEKEKRKMFGIAIELMIRVGMENHVYRFNNKIHVQKTGGPIGLALTGEVADCYMLNWDKKFLEKLKTFGLKPLVYSRLKDDILLAIEAFEKGTKLIDNELIFDEEKSKEDELKSDSTITMEVLKDIANSIDDMITFTFDTPSNYIEGKMPALDLKVSVNEEKGNRIDFEFYEKPTKNPKVILADSAINSSSKRTILTQECIRRLRNTKVELGEECRNKHLSDFMLKLKNSGYKEKYRKEILDSALKGFDKMLEDDKKGVKPLFRSKDWNKEEREVQKKSSPIPVRPI